MLTRTFCRLLLPILLAHPLHGAYADEKDDARIQAVAEFLVERAEANLMYSFENRLKKDEELKCYFPETYAHIMQGNLRVLISARDEWQRVLKRDIDSLIVGAVAHKLAESIELSRANVEAIDAYLQVAQVLDIEYQGKPYRIDFIDLKDRNNGELVSLINGFYDDFNNLNKQLQSFNSLLIQYASNDPCAVPHISSGKFRQHIDNISYAFTQLSGLIEHIEKHGARLQVNQSRLNNMCSNNPDLEICHLKERLLEQWLPLAKRKLDTPLGKVTAAVMAITAYLKETEGQDYTFRALRAMELLKDSGMDEQKLAQLKNNVLFFARLADAKDKADAKVVLQEYTLPPVSFMIKRQPPGSAHWLISSYFGYSGGQTLDGRNKDVTYNGMFVPVGLEYSYALSSGASMSAMLAPFDFGYPVSLQLNGSDLGVGADQIVAPSLSLSYGFADYPLVLGLSLQQGRDIGNGDTREKRAMLFLAFDMPLLQLY